MSSAGYPGGPVTYGSIFSFVYRCDRKNNDVALLMTANQLKWTKDVRPACLPQPLTKDFSGSLAIVAGWGFTHEDRSKGMQCIRKI